MQCCAVYSRKLSKVLYFQECSSLEEIEQKKNLNDILLYVNDFKFLKTGTIQKIHTFVGVWYLALDARSCCHLVYTQKNYPSESALRFLSSMKKLVCSVNQYDTKSENIITFVSNRIYNLIIGYNNSPDYEDNPITEQSINSIIVDLPDNTSPTKGTMDPKSSKNLLDSKAQVQNQINFYPKPTTSLQFNEYLCYGTMLLIAFLMLILIIIKIC